MRGLANSNVNNNMATNRQTDTRTLSAQSSFCLIFIPSYYPVNPDTTAHVFTTEALPFNLQDKTTNHNVPQSWKNWKISVVVNKGMHLNL